VFEEAVEYIYLHNSDNSIKVTLNITGEETMIVTEADGLHMKEYIPSETTSMNFRAENIAPMSLKMNAIYNDGTYTSKIFETNKPFSELSNSQTHEVTITSQVDNNALNNREEPLLTHYVFNLYDEDDNLLVTEPLVNGNSDIFIRFTEDLPEKVKQAVQEYYSLTRGYQLQLSHYPPSHSEESETSTGMLVLHIISPVN